MGGWLANRRVIAALIGTLCLCAAAHAQVLYDGPAGTAPASQGWLSHYSIPGAGVQTVAGGKTTYDSTAANSERGGYSSHTFLGALVNPAFPVLNRSTGYAVSIDMRVISETHVSTDRAGFSIIALSSDLMGIELGFWTNEIWAQSAPFTHAEGFAFDTTAAIRTYDVAVGGSSYTLFANGVQVATGPLRDYSAFGFPYTTSSWLFIGDDTTSAAGSFEFSRLAVVIPEAGMTACVLLLSGTLFSAIDGGRAVARRRPSPRQATPAPAQRSTP